MYYASRYGEVRSPFRLIILLNYGATGCKFISYIKSFHPDIQYVDSRRIGSTYQRYGGQGRIPLPSNGCGIIGASFTKGMCTKLGISNDICGEWLDTHFVCITTDIYSVSARREEGDRRKVPLIKYLGLSYLVPTCSLQRHQIRSVLQIIFKNAHRYALLIGPACGNTHQN